MKHLLFLFGFTLILSSCVKEWGEDENTSLIEQFNISENFGYETVSEVDLEISALDNDNEPLSKVPFSVSYWLDTTEIKLGTGITSQEGKLTFNLSLPSFVEEAVVTTDYIGLPAEHVVKVQSGINRLTVGGKSTDNARYKNQSFSAKRLANSQYTYLSSYNAVGVPDNLMPVDDIISQDLLDMVNASLPESYPVPIFNSQYLDDDLISDTQLKDSAEIWITFIHEGAGWRNALGFYSYNLDNPPQSVDEIEEFKIIFPNASFLNGGGGLISGNKVSLGKFPPNTGISWFLIPDGWNGSEVVIKSNIKYSNKDFNTFTSSEFRQHTVLLADDARELFLLGLEDISRPGGDNDFNDAVFYITADPYSAIIKDKLEITKTSGDDADEDGVADKNDKYPNDPNKAFDNYSPGPDEYGSLAFEDNWPAHGDYDMNDAVIDYNYQIVTNTNNKVVEIIAKYSLRAVGATFRNGFGLSLPIAASLIQSSTITGSSSSFNVNNQEPGQENAVFILFDDAHDAIQSNSIVNTIQENGTVSPFDFELRIEFIEPVSMNDIGYAPYNPFIFVSGDRSREVHLPDHLPTDKMDNTRFGSEYDTSDPEQGRYYKSKTNLPWAINIPIKFDYPIEYFPINHAHLKFKIWAESGGKRFEDWYLDNNGYRNHKKVFQWPE